MELEIAEYIKNNNKLKLKNKTLKKRKKIKKKLINFERTS